MIIKIMEQKWNLLSSEHFRIESDLVGIEKYAKMISENINDFCRVAIRFFSSRPQLSRHEAIEIFNLFARRNNIINWKILIIITLLFTIIYFISCDNKFAGSLSLGVEIEP